MNAFKTLHNTIPAKRACSPYFITAKNLRAREQLCAFTFSSHVLRALQFPLLSGRERASDIDHLDGDDFRHPLDQQNTSILRSIPGLEAIAKNFLGPAAEQVLLLENISTSIKIGPDQLPSVHKLLCEAAEVLQMEAPELYVRQHPVPNAYTLAIAGHTPFVVIHTALLELLSPQELQSVLAHELGHLKCDHGLWLTVANVLASGTVTVLPVVSGMVEESLLRWLRAAELTCDRAALVVARDPKIVISALMKLAGGSPSFASELNVDAFLEQARSYDEATSSVLGWYLRNAQTRALSHPLPVMRAREIDRWASSPACRALAAKARTRGSLMQVAEPLRVTERSGNNSSSSSNGASSSAPGPSNGSGFHASAQDPLSLRSAVGVVSTVFAAQGSRPLMRTLGEETDSGGGVLGLGSAAEQGAGSAGIRVKHHQKDILPDAGPHCALPVVTFITPDNHPAAPARPTPSVHWGLPAPLRTRVHHARPSSSWGVEPSGKRQA